MLIGEHAGRHGLTARDDRSGMRVRQTLSRAARFFLRWTLRSWRNVEVLAIETASDSVSVRTLYESTAGVIKTYCERRAQKLLEAAPPYALKPMPGGRFVDISKFFVRGPP
ncbi:hypothetical protein NDK50_11430 [Paraburkholderia bryophila]|uniref:hypothetical protein n=1 Tax=Paraburkholderia bryophila TaxID=420952 RepID=UPI00234A52A5|nr:hypothetical protein [Paraburkholderia bryophila]WCM18095.1 hypothetical protein NDK50_11430 [Paraburkholderia bryophila]